MYLALSILSQKIKVAVALQVYILMVTKIGVYSVVEPILHQNVKKYQIQKLEKTFYSKIKFVLRFLQVFISVFFTMLL